MKNLFGLVPGEVYGWPKNVLHWSGIDECIADLHLLFPRQFCIVDGIEGMQGNGPILGTAKHAGVLVAGAHPPSVDATCCQVMGIDPRRIQYLQLIAKRTGWRATADVRQIGELTRSVYTPFELPPGFEKLRLEKGRWFDRAPEGPAKGAELVEFSLVMIPLFGILFLVIDLSWMLFARATLQYAVREGVRYAVTGQTMSGMGQDASIRSVVQQSSMGILAGLGGGIEDRDLCISIRMPTWRRQPAMPAAMWCRCRRAG